MRLSSFLVMSMLIAGSVSSNTAGTLDDQATIVIPASQPATSRVFIFTDTSCPYCALLHRRRALFSRHGIEIHYLFYPRTGPGTESFRQAVAVWCSSDRLAALNRALNGETLRAAHCENPVRQHYELARELQLRGTPAVVSESGLVAYGVPSPDKFPRL